MSKPDVASALAWNPGANSYVIAEDSGLYPTRRHPATMGLNYHIQDVQFKTAIGPNQISKSSNLLSGSMTILEPYGVTLIDSLVAASFDGTRFADYALHPMMLQLEFKGYDDKGNPIPDSEMVLHRKRFPIVMKHMKLTVTGKGAEYKIDFAPTSQQGMDANFEKTAEEYTIVAGTVKEFFQQLEAKYAAYQGTQVATNRVDFAEFINFDIDKTIADSKIVYDKQVPLTISDPAAKGIKLDKTTFTIPKGSSILDVINRVMSHSDYLIKVQLKLEDKVGGPLSKDDQTKVFNSFKTLSSVEYQGKDSSGQIHANVFDTQRGRRVMNVTYKIHQYTNWNGSHPAIPLFPDSIAHTIKDYNYLYTGKNTDIVDLKMEFNTTFYTAINTYNTQFASSQSSQDTGNETDANLRGVVSLNPSNLATFVPQLNLVPSATPMRYRHVIGDANSTTGMNVKHRPAAQVAADVIKSIYSSSPTGNGDMIKVALTIVGDSTLLKQDDWYYIPSPTKSDDYNSWDTLSHSDFVAKHGHIRMDHGQIVVRLTVNTPIDIDADIGGNQGLVYPQPGTRPALFSGQYYIIHIDSKFVNGKFEQVLHLSRYLNTDYPETFNLAQKNNRSDSTNDSVVTGTNNDLKTVPTNTANPASESNGDGQLIWVEVNGSRE